MADENDIIETQEPTEQEIIATARQLFAILFEHIVPWGQTGGDTGLSSRLKLQRNFEKIKAWIDASPSFFLSRLFDDTAYGHITFNKGLTANGYTDDEDIERPALDVRGKSTFTDSLGSPEFISNFLGGQGWALQRKEFINAAGEIEYRYVLEVDGLDARQTVRVYALIASQLLGENDNRVFTAMMEVHHYDPETGKVWMNTNQGKLLMPLRAGDCIMVQRLQPGNDVASGGDGYITKSYELRLTEVGSGGMTDENGDRLDWVKFEAFATMMENGTPDALIEKLDTFCRVDNLTDADRKGIIQMITVGTNAPYMDIIYGMKTDPLRALKGRIGNLTGITTNDFGQLQGFGVYTNNLYGTGIFRNAQTGERLSARISATQSRLTSLYKETTYDISEDDNHISNGFFVREMEDWEPCTPQGAAAPTQGASGLLVSDGRPMMVNGRLVSTQHRQQAAVVEYEGVPMLKLYNMGVAQDFGDMDPNGTHKELESDQGSTTTDVPNTLYLGVRILPITDGTLSVRFVKDGGTTSGYQRTINTTMQWLLVQAQDSEQSPWDFTGNGRLILSYTGECMIRFVALTNNPIEDSKAEFSTRITQTARIIKAEADAVYATRTMHSELSIEVGRIGTEVTNNKTASDAAKAAIEARLGDIESFDNNTATWITQTSNRIGLWASSFDENGNVIGLSQLRIDVNGLQTTIGTLATVAAMNNYVQNLQHQIDSIEEDGNDNASAISQLAHRIDLVVGQFDQNGNFISGSWLGLLKDSAHLLVTTEDLEEIGIFINANDKSIKMAANMFSLWNAAGTEKLFGVDSNGDIYYKGQLAGNSLTDDLIVGDTQARYFRISPSLSNGRASISGYQGNVEKIFLGWDNSADETRFVMRRNPVVDLFFGDGAQGSSLSMYAGGLALYASGHGDQAFGVSADSNGKYRIGSIYGQYTTSGWPTAANQVGIGQVWLDGATLRVRVA